MSFTRAIFYAMPKAGDVYVFDDDSKPPAKRHKVRVIGTQDKWVNYQWVGLSIAQDEWMTRSSFNFCYERAK